MTDPKSATPKQWVVTLGDDATAADLTDAIAATGFAIETQLDEIGVVTGTADDETAERLRALKGVADVAADVPIDIGPPGGPDRF